MKILESIGLRVFYALFILFAPKSWIAEARRRTVKAMDEVK